MFDKVSGGGFIMGKSESSGLHCLLKRALWVDIKAVTFHETRKEVSHPIAYRATRVHMFLGLA
jgi:hypothetical protein